MKRLFHLTLLVPAVALLAIPVSAATSDAPAVCSPAAAAGDTAPAPVLEPAGDGPSAAIAETASEPLPLADPIGPIEPQPCGNVFCPAGTTCCNPLCSACTPPGVSCTLGDCGHGPTS